MSTSCQNPRSPPSTSSTTTTPEKIDYNHVIAAELNNVASEFFTEGELNMSMDLYIEADKTITDVVSMPQKQRDDFDLKLVDAKKTLRKIKNMGGTKSVEMDDLDLYFQHSFECDAGARPILESIKINNPFYSHRSYQKAIISFNIGVNQLKKNDVTSAEKSFDLARKSILNNNGNGKGSTIVTPAILNNIGMVHYKSNRIEDSLNCFYDALEVARQLLMKHSLIDCRGMSIMNLTNFTLEQEEEAKQLYRFIGTILSNIGRLLFAMGRHEESLRMCREALKMRQVGHNDKHIDVYCTMYNIGLLYQSMGYFEKALHNYQLFLNYLQRNANAHHHGPNASIVEKRHCYNISRSRDCITVLINILLIYCRKLFFDVASFDLDQEIKKLENTRRLYGYDDYRIPVIIHRIASMLSEQKEYKFAVLFYLEQLRVEKILIGDDHPELAFTLNFIGHAYLEQDKLEEAMAAFDEALYLVGSLEPTAKLTSQFKRLGTDKRVQNGLFRGIILYNVGMVYIRVGSFAKALTTFKQALALQRQSLGDYHADIAAVMHSIGIVQREMGNPMEAMKTFKMSHDIRLHVFGENHELVAQSMYQIGRIHDEIGNVDEALKAYKITLKVEKTVLGAAHPEVVMTMCHIGQIYHSMGDIEKALDIYNDVLTITRDNAADATTNNDIRRNNRGLARAGAEGIGTIFGQRRQRQQQQQQQNQPSLFSILNTIGNLHLERGNSDEAMSAFTEAARSMQGRDNISSTGNSGVDNNIFMLLALCSEQNSGSLSQSFSAAAAA